MDIVLFAYQTYDGRAGRDHHFARLLSKSHRVFWVDEPFSLKQRPVLRWSFRPVADQVIRATPPGGTSARKYWHVHRLNEARWLAGLKLGLSDQGWGQAGRRVLFGMTPVWPRAYSALQPEVSVYDAHDVWDLMPHGNARLSPRFEDLHAAHADLVVTSSAPIAQRFAGRAKRVEIVPDGCEYERFAEVPELAPHPQIAALPEPRFVYTGGLDECFDTQALSAAARHLPDASFVLIGPELDSLDELPELSNVHRLGAKPYAELPAYMAGATACLLPYRTTPRGVARDPIKLYEYLATGRPIASSPIPRAREFQACVTVSDGTPQGFAAACAAALLDQNAEQRRSVARANTWERRVSDLESYLNELLS